jgi:hypothetical protein
MVAELHAATHELLLEVSEDEWWEALIERFGRDGVSIRLALWARQRDELDERALRQEHDLG